MANVVHVVGTAGISETLVSLLATLGKPLGVDEVTFHKRSIPDSDVPRVRLLTEQGALLVADGSVRQRLEEIGFAVPYDPATAVGRATAVVDTTPYALQHKGETYDRLTGPRGYVALEADPAFGSPVAWGVNDYTLVPGNDRFLRVAGVGAHALSTLVLALGTRPDGGEALVGGRFVVLRRSADVSMAADLVASPLIHRHRDARFGTQHAAEAHAIFETMGRDVPVVSSALDVDTALMDAVHFSLRVTEPVSEEDVLRRLSEQPRVAFTEKLSANPVYAFGRDHGLHGRLFNSLVVPKPALLAPGRDEVAGFAFIPHAGTVLYTALACALWLMDPDGAGRHLHALDTHVFEEV